MFLVLEEQDKKLDYILANFPSQNNQQDTDRNPSLPDGFNFPISNAEELRRLDHFLSVENEKDNMVNFVYSALLFCKLKKSEVRKI